MSTTLCLTPPRTCRGLPQAFDPLLAPQLGARREQAEAFIAREFARHYGARVEHFMPRLLGMRADDGRMVAACGLRPAGQGPLFLERYVETPAEQAIAARLGFPVERSGIVEVGNLAMVAPCSARVFIAALTAHLASTPFRWVAATVVPMLRNAFLRLGVPLLPLARAGTDSLSAEELAAWGRYYDEAPQVVAVSVAAACAALGMAR